jgi:hypothetical protein
VIADYTLSKYQASDGALVWSAKLDDSAAPLSITVSGGTVAVGSSECGSVGDPLEAAPVFPADKDHRDCRSLVLAPVPVATAGNPEMTRVVT